MIQLYVKCKNLENEILYEEVKKEYTTKEEAYYDFRKCIHKLQHNIDCQYKFYHIWSHVPGKYDENMKRCDYAIKVGQCRNFPYKVTFSLRGLNK